MVSPRRLLFLLVPLITTTLVVLYAQSPTGTQRVRWEYKISTCGTQELNMLGNDGWELVSTTPAVASVFSGTFNQQTGQIALSGSGPISACSAYLKRPK
jgi:hypothetical protein